MFKRILSILLSISILIASVCTVAAEDDGAMLILPASLTEIKEEAFEGDTTIKSVIIPNTVESIGSRAFADCSALTEVVIASRNVEIAADAFEGCSEDVIFNVYPDTTADHYALTHGYPYKLLDGVNGSLERLMKLVEENGGSSSILQSSTFMAKRLIIKLSGNRMPDISAYNPKEIVRDSSDIIFVQFDSVEETIECYGALYNDSRIAFVEADGSEKVVDTEAVGAAGVVDSNLWKNEDPMGFDVYAPFVAAHGSGSATIAVIDSGVKKSAVYNSILRSDGYNFVTDNQGWDYDPLWHGSWIASVIADSVGNAGVNILPVRVVSANGTASLTLIGKAIQYAVTRGASVINLSLNCEESKYISAQIDAACAAGVTVVVAAGNDAKDTSKVFPANHSSVVTVSGLDHDYTLTGSTNYGSNVSYTAPGNYVKTSIYGAPLPEGTSFAAPQIAAAFALVGVDPYHSVDDMRAACMDLGVEGKDSSFGYGLPQLAELAHIGVTKVSVDVPTTVTVNQQFEVNYSVEPSVATNQMVTITSDNEDVIKLDLTDEGKVVAKALSKGSATLTITSNDNSAATTSVAIEVVQPVTEIVVSGSSHTLYKTRTMMLSAEVLPSDANNKDYGWSSSNTNVAVVDGNGLVTPIATGSVTITATAKDGYGAVGTWDLTVEERPEPESIKIYCDEQQLVDGVITIAPEETAQVYAIVSPDDAIQTVNWFAMADTGSIEVSTDGVIKPVTPGYAYVCASTPNGVYASQRVLVLQKPDSVTISGDNEVLTDGTIQLTAKVSPDNVTDATVTWSSSNEKIAEVDQNGVVTGVTPGECNIIATANGDPSVFASHTVVVAPSTFVVNFNANGGTVTPTSMIGMVYEPLGTLPTPTRDYYTFNGWYTAASGGTQVTASTVYTVAEDITLYAQWTQKGLSEWVLQSEVPAGAEIVETSYSYRETYETTSSSLSGWTSNGSYWKTTQTGSRRYAPDLPSGFNTSHSLYCGFTTPYTETSTSTYRRTVSNTRDGYIYWHWMYNVAYANTTERMISSKKGSFNADGSSGGLAFNYFYAFFSTTNYPYLDNLYCCSAGLKSYNCAAYCNGLASSEKTSTSGLGTPRFFRFDRYTSTYTDQYLYYKYYRDISYSSSKPSGTYSYTNLTTYVKYRAK